VDGLVQALERSRQGMSSAEINSEEPREVSKVLEHLFRHEGGNNKLLPCPNPNLNRNLNPISK
jgi:hypothetical protein